MRILHTLIILLLAALSSGAQTPLTKGYTTLKGFPFVMCSIGDKNEDITLSDSLFDSIATGVQFKVNRTAIDTETEFYRMYTKRLLPLLQREHLYLKKVFIRGAASPEGPYENNRYLGTKRAESLMQLVSSSLNVGVNSQDAIEAKVVNEDYAYLINIMEKANDPDAAFTKHLMDSCQWNEAACKQALQSARNGALWNRLAKTYFPRLRTARVVFLMGKHATNHTQNHTPDTIYVRDTVYISHTKYISDTVHVMHMYENTVIYKNQFEARDSVNKHVLLAVKSNLLFDALTALNASVELPLGKQFSLSAEVVWPWWVDKKHNKWCMEIGNVGLEGRYYFRPAELHSNYASWKTKGNRPLSGWFVGVHADYCYYDLEWKGSGRQGEAVICGLTGGYQKPISRYMNLEFSLGIGVAGHQYRTYDASEDEQHLWRDKEYKNRWYVGPTKAKISLVWLLQPKCNNKCKKGGAL